MKRSADDVALKAFRIAVKSSGDHMLTQLLTDKEKIVLGRRLLIAEAIRAGKTRMEINTQIRVSPNTFAQINRWLETEQKDYVPATSKQSSRKHMSRYKQRIEPFSYEDLKRRYPMHFLLFNLVEELWKEK
jgi:uncharacterized protein YerC